MHTDYSFPAGALHAFSTRSVALSPCLRPNLLSGAPANTPPAEQTANLRSFLRTTHRAKSHASRTRIACRENLSHDITNCFLSFDWKANYMFSIIITIAYEKKFPSLLGSVDAFDKPDAAEGTSRVLHRRLREWLQPHM